MKRTNMEDLSISKAIATERKTISQVIQDFNELGEKLNSMGEALIGLGHKDKAHGNEQMGRLTSLGLAIEDRVDVVSAMKDTRYSTRLLYKEYESLRKQMYDYLDQYVELKPRDYGAEISGGRFA